MASAATVTLREQSARLFTWVQVGILAAIVGILYGDLMADLAAEWWTRPEASYGILIPPFALYVTYLRRREILSAPECPDFQGLAGVAAACLMFLTGRL